MVARYIVSYDISDNKTRAQVAKVTSGYIYRVQKSVFEGIISQRGFNEFLKRLRNNHLEATDSIRIYKVCEKCVSKVEYLGHPRMIEDMKFLIL